MDKKFGGVHFSLSARRFEFVDQGGLIDFPFIDSKYNYIVLRREQELESDWAEH